MHNKLPVCQEDRKYGRGANNRQHPPGGQPHGHPWNRQGGEGVADHDHHERNSSKSHSTVLNNWP